MVLAMPDKAAGKQKRTRVKTGPARKSPKRRGVTTDEHILETAGKLFARYGYDGVSTKQIARESGVTIGALYHYFPSKEVVYREVTKNVFTKQSMMPTDGLESAASAEQKMQQMIASFVRNIIADREFGLLLQRELLAPQADGPDRMVKEYFKREYGMFRELLLELVPGTNQDAAFASVLALCFGFANLKGIYAMVPGVKSVLGTPEEIARHATQLLLNGLRE
jgi:TetR/AcrR family transcriptional regulator